MVWRRRTPEALRSRRLIARPPLDPAPNARTLLRADSLARQQSIQCRTNISPIQHSPARPIHGTPRPRIVQLPTINQPRILPEHKEIRGARRAERFGHLLSRIKKDRKYQPLPRRKLRRTLDAVLRVLFGIIRRDPHKTHAAPRIIPNQSAQLRDHMDDIRAMRTQKDHHQCGHPLERR